MTEESKQRVRNQIRIDNEKAEYGYEWHIIDGLLGESVSPLVWNKNCQLIYVDMDGYPNICVARYDADNDRFIGVSDWLKGNYMHSVIAYRQLKQE